MKLSLLCLFLGGTVSAASPTIGLILPRGGQRGTDVSLKFQGANLADAQEIIVYYPGIAVKKIESAAANEVKATMTIAPDCRLGEHAFRIRTATGISDLRTFWVGALPIVEEKEPNNDFANPQSIAMNVTVHGVIANEDVDYFVVECKKGQRLSVEIEGMRLGNGFFDPCVTIFNDRQFELAVADDSYITGQDGGASIAVPADGKYIIQVRETSFGNGNYYRLHVGNFPPPTAVIPAGGKPGETVEARFLGDPLGEIKLKITFPSNDTALARVHAQNAEGVHPAGIRVRINDLNGVVETVNANNLKSAIAITPPCAVHGTVGVAGEMDHYKFAAKKGLALEATVFARRLGSALDPVIGIYAIKKDGTLGNGVIGADDVGGPDSYVRFNIPEDGDYAILIRDHLNNGGPSYFYRIELQQPQPGAGVHLPRADNNNSLNQERQTWCVPKGGRIAMPVTLRRNDWGGPATMQLDNLPTGVKASVEPIDFSTNVVPVILEAAPDAANAFRFISPRLSPNDKLELKATDRANVEVVLSSGQNNSTYHMLPTDRVAVAVTETAPFGIDVIDPKAPLVQNGSMQLKVVAKRAKGFNGPIQVIPVMSPPNVGINYSNQIPENATECLIPISAASNAAARKWRLAFMAVGNAGGGNVWVGSQLFTLEVSPPLVALVQQRTAVEQGQNTQVVCKVTANTPFAGKAKATLAGLPPKVTAAPIEFESSQSEITFNVTTDKTSPAGKHNCFVQVTVVKDGETILHNLGGGEFRIDVPLPAKTSAAAQVPPKPAAAPPKPLSRLEQLRKEQEEREKSEAKPPSKSP